MTGAPGHCLSCARCIDDSAITENTRGAFDSAKNHKRQRRKRQSVTAKREKSQTRGAFDSAKNQQAPTPQAPVRNRQTRKVANAKVRIGYVRSSSVRLS